MSHPRTISLWPSFRACTRTASTLCTRSPDAPSRDAACAVVHTRTAWPRRTLCRPPLAPRPRRSRCRSCARTAPSPPTCNHREARCRAAAPRPPPSAQSRLPRSRLPVPSHHPVPASSPARRSMTRAAGRAPLKALHTARRVATAAPPSPPPRPPIKGAKEHPAASTSALASPSSPS
jgi:hypothetical protein